MARRSCLLQSWEAPQSLLLSLCFLGSCQALAQASISPPKDGGLTRTPAILPPGVGNAHDEQLENASERRGRLEGAGVALPLKPTPVPSSSKVAESKLAAEVREVVAKGKNEKSEMLRSAMKASLDFASWWHYVKPAKQRHLHDFSWGSDFLFNLDGTPLPATGEWVWSTQAGPRYLAYNGGVYANSRDLWKGSSAVYADFAGAEAGGVIAQVLERSFGENHTFGLGFRAGYLPLRWVRAYDYSLQKADAKSDAVSHFSVSWTGMEGDVSLVYGFGRLAEVAIFSSVHGAWPWQIRGRAGLRLSLMSRDGEQK